MAKISKIVPQQEKASSSSRPSRSKLVVPPRIEECIPPSCEISSDFKIEKPISTPGQCEPMSRCICLITKDELEQASKTLSQCAPPPPPPEEVSKPPKEKKRKRGSSANTPKPKKSTVRKPKADTVALSPETAQRLWDQEEEDDDDCLLVARKRGSTGASKSAEPVVVDAFQQKVELVEQLREEHKMKEAKTLGWRQGLDNLTSEKETLREHLDSLERQFQMVKEESIARGRIIEELKAKSATELAKAKFDTEAIISSYRADTEASNTRAKEISIAAEVRLSYALDHARRQSRRNTLEEVHARGLDLSADIEKAKTSEDESTTLLSNDEDSTSGSDSEGDKDEGPEDEALEDAAPEGDATAEYVAPE
uniref:Uncharacterized protein LOC104223501 n=1 Tax=Nicotiana sylvestris TaxID=4096 RepID=A0A1U7W7S7_NICSY|nr:PREDICTED: uncharacterized protein LOC104223501 [Nicotiana sylvestris]